LLIWIFGTIVVHLLSLMGIFTPKKKNIEVTFIEEKIILIKGEKWHKHDHEMQEIRNAFALLIKQNKKIMSKLTDLEDKIAAQNTALDSIGTNVTGIQADVTAMKAKIDELKAAGDAAVNAALDELSPLLDGVSSKIDAVGATTASLDASTDPANL
jgi:uncharacterized coiled-coil protein SlyX